MKQKMTKAELIAALENAERRIASLEQDAAPSQDTARFRSFVEHSNDGIILFDEQGNITIWNSTMEKMTGIPRAEITGSSYWEMQNRLFTPQALSRIDLEKLKTDILTAFATGRHYSLEKPVEFEIETPGGRRFVRLSSFSIKTEKGFCLGSIMHDITERKWAVEALREKEENLRAFFDTVDHFLFVTDGQGNILLSNEAVARRLGYSTAELQGQNILMLHPPQRRAEAALILRDILADKTDCCPIPLLAKDGREIPAETRIVKGRWSGRDAIFAVTKDLSEMMASEEKFSRVFQSSPAPMALTDLASGKYVEINEAFLQILGFTRAEVVGRTATELNLFADPAQRAALLGRMKEQGYLRDEDVLVRVKSGDLLQGIFAAEFVHLQEKTLLLTVMNDVTEHRQVEKLVQAQRDLARVIATTVSSGDAWAQCLEIAMRISDMDSGGLYLFDENRQALELVHSQGLSAEFVGEVSRLAADSPSAQTVLRGEPMNFSEEELSPLPAHRREGLRSLVVIPIRYQSQVLGCLNISSHSSSNALELARDTLESIASEIGSVIIFIRTEEALRRSEALLSESQRIGRIGHVEWRSPRNSLICSDEIYDILDLPRNGAPITQDTIAGMMLPEDQAALRKLETQLFAQRKDPDYEYRILLEDGSERWLHQMGKITYGEDGLPIRMLAVIQDVTERKQAEEARRESDERYRLLFETMSQGVVFQNADGYIIHANPSAEEILGLNLDQMQGRSSIDPRWKAIHEDGSDFPGETHPAIVALQTGKPVRNVIMGVYNPITDSQRWININAVPRFRNGDEKPYQVYATFEDITRQKLATELLEESQASLELAQSIASLGSWELDPVSGVGLSWSKEMFSLFHRDPAQGVPPLEKFIELVHPDDRQALLAAQEQAIKEKRQVSVEYRAYPQPDTLHHFKASLCPLFDAQGNLVHMSGTVLDISEIKQAFEQTRESEGKYRILAENISDVIWILDAATLRYRYVSPSILQLRGYSAEEVMAQEIYDGLTHEFARKLVEVWGPRIEEARQGVEKTYIDEIEQPCKNGGTVWTETITRFARNSENGALEVYGVSRNITERKRAEETLRESNETAQAIINAATESVFLMEIDGTVLAANETTAARFGKKVADILGTNIYDLVPPHVAEARRKLIEPVFREGRPVQFEDERFGVWIENNAYPVLDRDGQVRRIAIYGRDMTERKRADERLRASNERFNALFFNAPLQAIIYRLIRDDDGQIVDWEISDVNPLGAESLGGDAGELVGKRALALFGNEVMTPYLERSRHVAASGEAQLFETYFGSNGRHYMSSVFMVGSDHYANVSVDITERKRAEETLQAEQTRFANVAATLPGAICTFQLRPDGLLCIPYASKAFEDVYGIPSASVTGNIDAIIQNVPPEQASILAENMKHSAATLQPWHNEYLYHHPRKGDVWVEGFSMPVLEADGSILWHGFVTDITERKRAEEVLQKSRMRVELALEGANAGMWDWNIQSGETVFNERWADIVGYSLQELEPINIQTWAKLCHPDDLKVSSELLGKHFAGETDYYECEARMKHRDGSWVWVLDRGRVMEWDAEGKPLRMFGTHTDITERKREGRYTEARLKLANLSQQEVEMEALMRMILDEAEALTDSSIGFFHFVDKDQGSITLQVWSTNTLTSMCTAKGQGAHYPVKEAGIWADGIRSGEACVYNDYQQLPSRRELPQGHAPVTRLISLPIKRNHLVVAALGVGNKPTDYDEHDLELVKRLAEEAFDIILRKRAEEDLRAGEEKYRGLLESLDSVISTVDYEGKLLFVNEIAASQLGSTVEELNGKIMNEVFPQEVAAAQLEMVRTAIRADRSAVYESQSIVNGIPRWYRTSVQPIHDPSGRVSHALVNATDINDIKTAQQELQDLNRTLEERVRQRAAEVQDLYDNSPAGYHSLDKNGGILMINQTQLDWMGYAREEVVGRSVVDFLSPKSIDAFAEIFPAFIQQGAVRDLDFEFIRRDGTSIPVLINATAIYDSHGNYLMSRSTVFDNTERKAAEETMRRVNLELERALRMKDEFLANMSHELRTPLNAILGLSESLIEQVAGALNDKQHKYLGTIHESGRHLLELINDILDLAKVEAGQVALDISVVDVLAVCESSLRMIKQLAHKKNQTVQVEIEKEIGMVRADERRLKQMIVNLLSNAVKFTPQDGSLGLTAKVDRYEGKLSITVWDRGIGISAADLERLFQPFVQVDSSLSRETSGTGLGLALVAQMARLHGGSIAVESQPQKGSRFTIVLPWQPAEALVGAPAQQAAGDFSPIDALENQGGMTILVVEDIENLVMLLGDYLEQNGFKVESAKNGFEGVALATRLKPDLILMDVMMPGMDGLEATRLIRQEESLQNVPIIAMTALAMPSDREHCLAAGMNDYISKPVNLKQLVRLIKIHLPDSSERKR